MPKMQIATTIGEVYAYVQSPAEAVRLYEGTGFTHLDFSFYRFLAPGHPFLSDSWEKLVYDAGNAAAALGFDFVQAHAPDYNPKDKTADHEAGMLAARRSIEACGMLGIPNLVIHTGITDRYMYPDGRDGFFEESRDFLLALTPELERRNVRLCVENSSNGNTQGRFALMTAQDMNDLIAFTGHPLIGACWDTGHGNMRGADIHEELMTLGKNLTAIHVHDNDGVRDQHLALFLGTLDVDGLMTGLRDVGYTGYFTFEADSFMRSRWQPGREGKPLGRPPLEVKRAALRFLYETGRSCLDAYGL